jgi:hypothetical protein
MMCRMSILAASIAWGDEAHAAFQLSGPAELTPAQPVQKGASMELRARIEPGDAAVAALPPVQEGGGFALIARASVPALVCYNDTIFRNDYDGDGR